MQRTSALEMAELEASTPDRHRIVRWLFFSAGALLVGIGVAGILLPLLPTTVFFLGAAACFGKSSPGAYRWLTTNRVFGRYLREYKEERGAALGPQLWSVGSLWLGLGVTAWFFQETWWVEGILALVGIGVTWHLVALRTIRR